MYIHHGWLSVKKIISMPFSPETIGSKCRKENAEREDNEGRIYRKAHESAALVVMHDIPLPKYVCMPLNNVKRRNAAKT